MIWAFAVAVILLVLAGLSNVALQRRVKQLQDEVNHLRDGQDLAERVSYLVHAGRTREAVALHSRATGMNPNESRHAVAVIAKHNPQL